MAIDWQEIDELLLSEKTFSALSAYRAQSKVGLHDAVAALTERRTQLLEDHAYAFTPRTPPGVMAIGKINAIGSPICAIEALWNGDTTHDWFINLFAVIENPSKGHPFYTEIYLCTIYAGDVGNQSIHTFALALQNELAQKTGAALHPAVWPPDDEAPRWWDHGK